MKKYLQGQTIIDNGNVVFNIYFTPKVSSRDLSYSAPKTFKFRGYTMENIGEADFYNISERELLSIKKNCVERRENKNASRI